MYFLSCKKYITTSGAGHVVDVSVFLAVVCFVAVLILPRPVVATTYVNDNFSNYSTGELESVSGGIWTHATYAGIRVGADGSYSAPFSAVTYADSIYYHNFDIISSSTSKYVSFYLYNATLSGDTSYPFTFFLVGTEYSFADISVQIVQSVDSDTSVLRANNGQFTATIPLSAWTHVEAQVICSGNIPYVFFNVNSAGWSGAYEPASDTGNCQDMNQIQLVSNTSYHENRIDDIYISDENKIGADVNPFFGPIYDPNAVLIYMNFPEEGYTFSTTTVNFHVTGHVGTTTGFMWVSAREYYDFYDGGRSTSTSSYITGDISADFQLQNLYSSTTYYATAIFEDFETGERILSNTVNFNVLATSTIFTDEDSGVLIGKIVGFYDNLMYRIKYTFPWGYIFLIQDKFNKFDDDAETLSDLDIVLPMEIISTTLGTPSTFPDVTIFSYTWLTTDNSYMADVYNEWILLNKYASYLLWFMLIFFLWRNTTYKTDRMN